MTFIVWGVSTVVTVSGTGGSGAPRRAMRSRPSLVGTPVL